MLLDASQVGASAGGVFRTVVEITNVSATAGMIIESFKVRSYVDHADDTSTPAYELDTVFGFFPGEALANQPRHISWNYKGRTTASLAATA